MTEELNQTIAKMNIVEARLSNIEKKVAEGSVANSLSNNDVENALNEYKHQMLHKLKLVRETLLLEGGDIQSIRNERDQAVNENIALKKENDRLKYRVQHLVKALNEEESKNK